MIESMDKIPYTLQDSTLTVTLPRLLDIHSTAAEWTSLFALIHKAQPAQIHVDASQTEFCDSAGLTFLTALKKQQATFSIKGLNPHYQTLYEQFTDFQDPLIAESPRPSLTVRVGQGAYNLWQNTKKNITFIGEIMYHFARAIAHPRKVCWGDFWSFIERTGPNALPIGALLGFILGLILSFQALMSLAPYGAQLYVVNLVNISLTRELGPLMTGIILAGRTASAFAAELGTMKLNQEIDALTTMGLGAVSFLVLPRVLAAILMTPLINLYVILFGYLGCLVVVSSTMHSFSMFYHQLFISFSLEDFITGIVKVFIFGILISIIGCMRGLKTKNHAAAIGESTTKSVVNSIVMLGIADGILSFICYVIGV